MLASGTSCSDDNTNFDPIGDELGIPYKDGHDVYGVEVWEETSVILTNYYSLIEEIIQEKTAKSKSIWWLSPAKEKCKCPLELFGSYYGENRSFILIYNQSRLQYEFIANYD